MAGGLGLLAGISPPADPSVQHHVGHAFPGKLRQQLPSCRGCRQDKVLVSVPGLGAGSTSHLSSAQCRSCHVSCGARENTKGTWKEFTACRANRAAFALISPPPHFSLPNGNSLLHGKCSPKKLYLDLLQTVKEQEKGSEVLSLLLEPGRAQGTVETSSPHCLQQQQLLGRGSRVGDGAYARITRVERDLISPSVQNCPLPLKPPSWCGDPKRFPVGRCSL